MPNKKCLVESSPVSSDSNKNEDKSGTTINNEFTGNGIHLIQDVNELNSRKSMALIPGPLKKRSIGETISKNKKIKLGFLAVINILK